MVAFDNVVINQRVEVRMRAGVYKGTVKYKGPINGAAGDWIGVALDIPVGQHDGMVNGRRYFACLEKHGVFTLAHHLRFSRTRRCLFNKYRTVKKSSFVEEALFDTELPEPRNGPRDPIAIDRPYSSLARAGSLEDYDTGYAPADMKYLRSSISAFKPPRPITAKSKIFDRRSDDARLRPLYHSHEHAYDDFETKPTIPKTHMPRDALRQQVKRGWERPHTHLVRDWSVHTARDELRRNLWNDF